MYKLKDSEILNIRHPPNLFFKNVCFIFLGAITSTGSPGSGSGVKSTPESLPISDNNVSTTNDALLDEHEWDNDADINVRYIFLRETKVSMYKYLE